MSSLVDDLQAARQGHRDRVERARPAARSKRRVAAAGIGPRVSGISVRRGDVAACEVPAAFAQRPVAPDFRATGT